MLVWLMAGFEMFCERCGTRYEMAPTSSGGKLSQRVLGAVGRKPKTPTSSQPMLTLCLSCRGYTCPACWNEEAALCQTCAPLPEQPVPQPVVAPTAPQPINSSPALFSPEPEPAFATEPEPMPWPVFVAPEVARAPRPEPVAVAEPEPEPVAMAEPEPVVMAEPEPEPEPVVMAEPEPVVMAQPEPEPVVMAEPEPVVMAEPEPEPEPVVMAEPEPVVMAEPEPEPEPVVMAEPEPVVMAEPEAEPEPEPAPVPQPARTELPPFIGLPRWPRVEPELPQAPPVYVIASQQSEWPPTMPLAPLPIHKPAVDESGVPPVRPCRQCNLPVSARAHFCRRCGSAQPLD